MKPENPKIPMLFIFDGIFQVSVIQGSDLQIFKCRTIMDFSIIPIFAPWNRNIYQAIWLKFMVNVGRYSIRGISLKSLIFNVILWWSDRLLQLENLGVLTQFSRKD